MMKYLQRPFQMALFGLIAALAATGCDTLSGLLSDAPPADLAPADPAASVALGQNTTCTTPNYVAKILWQGDQPTMTFGRKPDQLTLNNAPAASATNPDGSITYRADGESATYARLYPNSTCFIQVVGAEDQVMLEENGTVGS